MNQINKQRNENRAYVKNLISPENVKAFSDSRILIQRQFEPLECEMDTIVEGYAQMPLQDRLEWSKTIRINRMVADGVVPIEFDKLAHCKRCGPVLGEVEGDYEWCPWCETLS